MRTHLTLFSLLAVLCLSSSIKTKAQAVNVRDSLALVDLYNSTNGAGWINNTNWLSGPVITWYGVTVHDDRRVHYIVLSSNNLYGSIPASLGNLTNLEYLNLSFNQLTGSIPPKLGNPVLLSGLVLNNNQLSGVIPVELGNPENLSELRLNNNQLTGNIPSTLGSLGDFNSGSTTLDLSYNQLSGIIPIELGYIEVGFAEETIINLSNNHLTGSIPTSFGSLGDIYGATHLDLSNNRLSGVIPSELADIGYLNSLNLSNNQLSGKIPSELPNEDYYYLNLSYNRFTFDGMELLEEIFPSAIYDKQKRIPIHIDNNVLSVSAGGTLSNNTYHWYGTNHNGHASEIISGDSTFYPTKSGIYYVRVFNSVATELTLRSDTVYYKAPVVTAFSDNSIQFNDHKAFLVYPNPANNIIQVQTNGTASFTLINQEGNLITTATINGKGFIYVSSFAPGIYYLKNNTTQEKQKVVIIR